ncbi:MAG: class B sortase [Oscillospiraceae bacterium]|nr:class B sortase [Oscillospiraceae bacterium]
MSGRRLEQDKSDNQKGKSKKIIWAGLIVSICVMVASVVYLGKYYWQVNAQNRLTDKLNDDFEEAKRNRPSPSAEFPSAEATPSSVIGDPGGVEDEIGLTERQRERRRLLDLEKINREVFASLLEQNDDWLGRITIPGTKVDTHYVRLLEDGDYYLRHTFDGKASIVGTVFLSAWNDYLLTDNNNVLCGHNVKGGGMFSYLMDYKKADAFTKAPVVVLDGLTGESVWIVFAAYITDPDWGFVNPCGDIDTFEHFLDEINERNWYTTDVDVNSDDRILTMYTCDYSYEDMRFAVHARLLRPGEEIPEAVTAAERKDYKKPVPPKQQKLTDITPNKTAVMQGPGRLYFYQPRDGGIDWYSGNQANVQGIYSNSNDRGITKNSFLAAVDYVPNQTDKMTYIAVGDYNKQTGIYLFSNTVPSSVVMKNQGRITPEGVDARNPALLVENNRIWLLYAVPREGGEDIYRLEIKNNKAAGEPELLRTVSGGSGTRPLGCYTINGAQLLLWHEVENKKVCGAWENGDPFALSLSGDNDRITFYGAVADGKIKAAVEKNGKFSFTAINANDMPKPAEQPAETPAPDPIPDPEEPADNGDSGVGDEEETNPDNG